MQKRTKREKFNGVPPRPWPPALCSPFLTPLRTQSGELVGVGERMLGQDQIIAMDYLVDNIRGSIPSYDALNPTGKATVDSAGVWPATKSAAEGERDEDPGRLG